MSYWNERDGGTGLEGCGCGANCGCASCRQQAAGLAEYYYEGEGRDEPNRGGGVDGLGEAAPAPGGATPLTRVPDASVPPWRAVCRIVARQDDAGFSVGTGILISPYHVLTCAHVIFPPQAPRTREITVHPGQNGPDASSPGFKANGWAVSPRWRAADCMTVGEDYGIVRLTVQHGFVPLIPFAPSDLLSALITMAGYPSTREPAARHMYQSQGRILGAIQIRSCTATTAQGRLIPAIPPGANLIGHNLNTEPSLSGAPMWFTKDTRRLAAIHAGVVANGTVRKAIMLNDAVRAQLFDWMRRTLPPPRRTSPGASLGDPVGLPPVEPPFHFQCPTGCAPAVANQCRAIVRRAVLDAIALANSAASKLEATVRDAETIRLFRAFFGHDPSRPVSWAGNQQSGLSVAFRLRKCAEELAGGRVMTYRCVTDCNATTNARTDGEQDPSLIELCPRFFNRPAGLPLGNQFFRAGVIVHEMLHLLFTTFFHHQGHPSGDPERRRDNAHCYEAFVLRLAGHAAEPGDVTACRNRPA